jgi:enoyl-[acyl-carrier protein] reductase I
VNFLDLDGKTIVVFGVANRKSVAYHVGRVLSDAGARVLYVVRSEERKSQLNKILNDAPIFVCDVEDERQIASLRERVAVGETVVHGLVHSIAFAEYEDGIKPFHETGKREFLRAVDISCYSLIAICNQF